MESNLRALVVIGLTFVSLGGCATTARFTSIPTTNEEFSLPITTIRDKFSDVSGYEAEPFFTWGAVPKPKSSKLPLPGPPIRTLEEQWGSAQRTEREWGVWALSLLPVVALSAFTGNWWAFGVTTLVFFPPRETYHWSKGPTHIEATTFQQIFYGYESILVSWEWSEEKPASAAQLNVQEQIETLE